MLNPSEAIEVEQRSPSEAMEVEPRSPSVPVIRDTTNSASAAA